MHFEDGWCLHQKHHEFLWKRVIIQTNQMILNEEKQTKQKQFQTQVRQLVETIDDMGNPFEEDTSKMSVKTAESIGKAQ
ncbi:hypothetical protein DPMN_109888 [Dreissena polymorpha]|uniref:Uncharacterized protein n=1 Tax=Dreissena polymorpha TaxID=45954 RepID=A0A9D4KBW4_DREPO|nr:hypothetical protein DPMN_109888 [Dreissena polymorpha]